MRDEGRTKRQLLEELAGLRRRVKRLERDRDARRRAEQDLRKSQELLASIGRAQSGFISAHDPRKIFDGLLKDILSLTGSEYGFIGEVLRSPKGLPYLKTHAVSNIAWDRKTRKLYSDQAAKGMEFHNLDTLFGEVLKTGKPVVSNRPLKDRRRGGLPEGHPPLESFLGIPFYSGKELLGMAGLANRPGGYDRSVTGFLRPLFSTCANIIEAYRINRDRVEARGETTEAKELLRSTVNGVADPIMVIGTDYRVLLLNRAARDFFQRQDAEPGELYCYQLSHHSTEPCPNTHADYLCPHREVLNSGEAVSTVHRHYGKDGVRYVEITSSPLRDAGGGIGGIIQAFTDITERRIMEEALIESEARFRKIFEHASIGMLIVDEEGHIVDSNPAFREMLGYGEGELSGMGVGVFTHPDEAERDKAALKELQEGKRGHYQAEKRYMHRDGRFIWGRLSASLMRVREGDPKLAVGLVEDITERKRAEDALRLLKKSIETISVGLAITDAGGRVAYANPAEARMHGYRVEELIGMDMGVLAPRELRKALTVDDMKDIGEWNRESVNVRKDGTVFPVQLTSVVVRDDKGVPTNMITISEDITERKHAEQALLKARARAEDEKAKTEVIIEAMGDGVSIQDRDFKVLYQNKIHKDLVGGDKKGEYCYQAYAHSDHVCEGCPIAAAFKDGRVHTLEKSAPRNGGILHIEIKASPLRNSRGEIVAGIEAVRDITGRKRIEEALRESIEEKETLIKEAHHRVKNNLSVIASLLRLQSRELKDRKTRSILDESRNRVQSMSLIHEKLYHSGDLKRINFKEYLRELAVRLFHSYETGSGVKLVLDIADVSLDVDTVIPCGLIVNELISNTMKYAFPDGRSGEVSVGFHPLEEGRYALTVKDDGVGFPEGLEFRNTDTLGMQIVTSLALQLDGSVELKREGGTEFTVTFSEKGV